MTRVRVRFLPGVPPTRGPGLEDADLWAIKDIQAGLSPEKWKRAAAPKSHRASGAACTHFTAALGKAACLCWLPSPFRMCGRALGSSPSPVSRFPWSVVVLDLNPMESPTASLCSGPVMGMLCPRDVAGTHARWAQQGAGHPCGATRRCTAPTRFPPLGEAAAQRLGLCQTLGQDGSKPAAPAGQVSTVSPTPGEQGGGVHAAVPCCEHV